MTDDIAKFASNLQNAGVLAIHFINYLIMLEQLFYYDLIRLRYDKTNYFVN